MLSDKKIDFFSKQRTLNSALVRYVGIRSSENIERERDTFWWIMGGVYSIVVKHVSNEKLRKSRMEGILVRVSLRPLSVKTAVNVYLA